MTRYKIGDAAWFVEDNGEVYLVYNDYTVSERIHTVSLAQWLLNNGENDE